MFTETSFDLVAALQKYGHEHVNVCHDPASGYLGIIAIHSTVLGPAIGGTRLWRYASLDEALVDALRLSRGMTYKNALAGLPFGGGKSVLPAPLVGEGAAGTLAGPAREAFFRAHGRFIERLKGGYITGEDVGTSPADMALIARETRWVGGLTEGVGDPSPFTARGVCRAIEAASHALWGSDSLNGRTVAIQGLGNVGRHLAAELDARGARLIVADLDRTRVAEVVARHGATAVSPEAVLEAGADILAPCALGGILNDDSIPRLRVAAVAGGANNQLLDPRHGDALAARGILYVPDYVANAGGVISGSVDLAGWDRARMETALDGIYTTVGEVLARARDWKVAPHVAADRLAEVRLSGAFGASGAAGAAGASGA